MLALARRLRCLCWVVALTALSSCAPAASAAGRPGAALPASLRTLTHSYADWLLTSTDPVTGELTDPAEVTYGEGYGPACAAVVAARAFHWTGDPRSLDLTRRLLSRSFSLVAHPRAGNSAFTHLFLLYYSLLAYEDIADALPPADRAAYAQHFRSLAHGYAPGSANGLTMSLCYDLDRALLGLRDVDWAEAGRQADRLAAACTSAGFINDSFDKNAHPIAYHLFVAALLSDTLDLAQRRPPQDPQARALLARLAGLRDRAAAWLDHFVAADGSLTLAERSRDQFFTCGAFVFLQAARGTDASEHLAWWGRFARPDGTIGVTPNHFPHALRVGYEDYSDVSMYNGLGFAYLARAERLLSAAPGPLRPLPRGDDTFVDEEAGYLHLRHAGSSVGISLRRHADSFFGGYVPAGGPLNLCLAGSPLRPLASPSFRHAGDLGDAEARDKRLPHLGVFAGFALRRGTQWTGPDWVTNPRVEVKGNEVSLHAVSGPADVVERLALRGDALQVHYTFTALQPVDEIVLQLPLLVSDGRQETAYRIDGNRVQVAVGKDVLHITLLPEQAAWIIARRVHLTSTSGAARQLSARIASRLRPGQTATCSFTITRAAP